jgi:serine/threonine protein kinase
MRDVSTKYAKGTVIANRYIIDELLGTGGFGAVYRVRDRRVKGNVFALKEVVDPNKHELDSFMSECAILKRLDHYALPHVYRVFEDHTHHRIYMLMDYADGPNLEKLRQQQPGKRFSFSRVMTIMAPIVDAITYLHTQQPPIIHRDIKPANIIVPRTDDDAILVDFGIAKEYVQDSTTTAVRHCSPGYGAPEHYATGTNIRTDVYSLGATFYALLTGVIPVDALHRMTQMSSKGVDPLQPVNELVPTLSDELAEVIARSMSINSDDRFASIEEFWQAVQYCKIDESKEGVNLDEEPLQPLATPSIVTTPTPPELVTPSVAVRSVSSPSPRARLLVMSLCCIVLIALVSGAIWGAGLLSSGQQANKIVPTATLAVVQSPRATATPTQSSVSVTPTMQPTPSPAAPQYPALTRSYNGTISNKYTKPSTDSDMALSQLQQDGMVIHGYFSVGTGLVGNGNFAGTVTVDSKVRFLVPSYGGLLPLFFDGRVQKDGSISGSYCSYQNNRCNYAGGGYGNWHVIPS